MIVLVVWGVGSFKFLIITNTTVSKTNSSKGQMSSCLDMAVKPWLALQIHFAYCAPPTIYTGRINMALWKCYNELFSGSFFLLGCRLHPAMYHSLASQTKLTTSFRHVFSFCHHGIPSQKRALSGLNFRVVSGTWLYYDITLRFTFTNVRVTSTASTSACACKKVTVAPIYRRT